MTRRLYAQQIPDTNYELDILANSLLENEVLLKSDVEKLIGERPVDVEERAAKNGVAPDDVTTVVDAERSSDDE